MSAAIKKLADEILNECIPYRGPTCVPVAANLGEIGGAVSKF